MPNGEVIIFDSMEHQRKDYGFDIFNLPVWVYEKNGYLFVRVVSPRIGQVSTIVIKNAKKEDIVIKNEAAFIDVFIENFEFSCLEVNDDLINKIY